MSAYALEDGAVYRTYVTTARGLEPAMAYYGLLDRTATRTPRGRRTRTLAPPPRRVRPELRVGGSSGPGSARTGFDLRAGRCQTNGAPGVRYKTRSAREARDEVRVEATGRARRPAPP